MKKQTLTKKQQKALLDIAKRLMVAVESRGDPAPALPQKLAHEDQQPQRQAAVYDGRCDLRGQFCVCAEIRGLILEH